MLKDRSLTNIGCCVDPYQAKFRFISTKTEIGNALLVQANIPADADTILGRYFVGFDMIRDTGKFIFVSLHDASIKKKWTICTATTDPIVSPPF